MVSDRYDRGFEKLKEIDGEAGKRVIESLKDISPDFARYLVEFPFGDIYSRTGLDLKSREIALFYFLYRYKPSRLKHYYYHNNNW